MLYPGNESRTVPPVFDHRGYSGAEGRESARQIPSSGSLSEITYKDHTRQALVDTPAQNQPVWSATC